MVRKRLATETVAEAAQWGVEGKTVDTMDGEQVAGEAQWGVEGKTVDTMDGEQVAGEVDGLLVGRRFLEGGFVCELV